MRYLFIVTCVLALAAVLVLTTGACGSGSTAVIVIDPLTLFSGTYCSFTFFGDAGIPDAGAAGWGTWVGDAAGMTSAGGSETLNRNGVILGPIPNGGAPYTIDANHKITILLAGSALYQGGISADGSLACWASVATSSIPQILIMGRKQGTHTAASLSGLYHLTAFFYNHAAMQHGAWWGTATFDGAGTGSTMTTINLDGNVGIPVMNAATYGVAADGTVTGTFLTGQDLRGAILANGELVVLSGSTTAGQVPMLVVLIKASAGASNAIFNGSYSLVAINGDTNPPPAWASLIAEVDANGAGGMGFPALVLNEDGTVTSGSGGASFYNVAPDGALTAGTSVGGISASGQVAMLSLGTTMGSDPSLWFFLRR